MIVGEPVYLLCLIPIVIVFYALRPGYPRLLFLLAVSYAFYGTYNVRFLFLLAGISVAAYGAAILIDRIVPARARLSILIGSLSICIAPLIFYKYLAPLLSITPRATSADWDFTLARALVPVGLSFYTFIALGYLIDVYVDVLKPERNPFRLGLYVGFFPQLTAGPIARATNLLPQLDLAQKLRAEVAMRGVQEILIGAVMKLMIADALSVPVDAIYAHALVVAPAQIFFASVLFAFQLYTDFAGYSLIAIGSARLLGIELLPNFQQPFLSASIQEFWRRWHMSLYFWLRDYVFTPLRLQWRKAPRLGMYAAMLITLTLVGVWHGVGWGFIVYGVVHGLLMVGSMATLAWRNAAWARLGVPMRLVAIIRVPVTFGIVMLTMVLLRAKDLGEAFGIYRSMFSAALFHRAALQGIGTPSTVIGLDSRQRTIYLGLVAIIVLGDLAARNGIDLARQSVVVRGGVYSACVLALIYQAIMSHGIRAFIYLQF
jgi:D-alanyl-lipoteichoic acid acyltransferase DltB (MBOAT superfamily)